MFIAKRAKQESNTHRGEIRKAPGEDRSTPAARRHFVGSGVHKHFAPPGLVAFVMLVMGISSPVFVTRAHVANLSTTEPQDQNIDFSKFLHSNANHARLPCLLCHRRVNNDARPSMPGGGGHLPCTGCHAKEFANSSSPLCVICHTNTQSGALKAFPPLSSFNMRFDHSRHARLGRVSCSTCHRPSRGGVAMSIPAGFSAHITCYQCHGPEAKSGGRDISSCGTCHQLGGYSRTTTQAAAYRVGFRHANHDATEKLDCSACHVVRAGMAQRRQVSAPLPFNHHAPAGASSCASCHTGKRAFGGDDFSVCTRCHKKNTWHF
ncbi:MAG TPA: cytochrome c3 family protein [Pyrinomonadaceae bacterium]